MNLLQLPSVLVHGIAALQRGRRVATAREELRNRTPREVGETLELHGNDPQPRQPRLCSVTGTTLRGGAEPERAPLVGDECVWWALRVHPRSAWYSRTIHLPVVEVSRAPFHLTDGQRSIRVAPDTATTHERVRVTRYSEEHPRAFADRRTPVTNRVNARFPEVADYVRGLIGVARVDFTEWAVPEGVRVTVSGWLVDDGTADEPVLTAWPDPDGGKEAVLTISVAQDADIREVSGLSPEGAESQGSLSQQQRILQAGGGCLVVFCVAAALVVVVGVVAALAG
ncbi:hypothetical protein FHX37_0004 [Haloactinospora alba]|uniref:Uncharacterized protein n=1 Tax=Haloactinospora alba TaxID=405555 RepID=A0A543NE98_9ACTN|nr:hypothetical protein [Haloactinospora alba]TQN27871.1 hypothetical protein FHX37_4602 [Haloactinospora alba]TQN30146.1 hypothetical protein FHX37_0004 [Haloactinospora alba]